MVEVKSALLASLMFFSFFYLLIWGSISNSAAESLSLRSRSLFSWRRAARVVRTCATFANTLFLFSRANLLISSCSILALSSSMLSMFSATSSAESVIAAASFTVEYPLSHTPLGNHQLSHRKEWIQVHASFIQMVISKHIWVLKLLVCALVQNMNWVIPTEAEFSSLIFTQIIEVHKMGTEKMSLQFSTP